MSVGPFGYGHYPPNRPLEGGVHEAPVDIPEYSDRIEDHADHELSYVETGTEYRRVYLHDDGRVEIGKSTEWDCTRSEIHCYTCGRDLDIPNNWEFTV